MSQGKTTWQWLRNLKQVFLTNLTKIKLTEEE